MKPTRARTPAGPDLGEGWSGMSCVHAVTRSVRDSAVLLDVTQGADLGAPYWAPPPARPYLEEVTTAPGRLRIALQTETFNGASTHPDCRAGVEATAKLCSQLGHEVHEVRLAVDAAAMARATGTIMSANLLSTLEDRANALGRELVEDDVEPVTWTLVQRARAASSADYARAVRKIHSIGRQVEGFLRDYDVILTPTMATPPPKLGVLSLSNPDLRSYGAKVVQTVGFTQLFNASGQPAMSLPLHWNADGLPIGSQFAGRFGDEATLFRLAGQLEVEHPWFERTPARDR